MIQAELLRGLATRNMTAVNQSFSRMWADVAIQSAVSNGQGIMADWSYHFHGEQIMSYSYGADWANDVLLFSAAAENTTWQLPTAGVDALGGMLSEGNAQMEWGGDFDWTLAGRGVDRPVTDFGVPFRCEGVCACAHGKVTFVLRSRVRTAATTVFFMGYGA